MKTGLISHENALRFIYGGKCFVTFLNTQSENRFTYKVFKCKDDDSLYFVSLLTGPEQYTFIGTLTDVNFYHSKKSTIGFDAQSVKVFKYVLNKLKENTLQDFIEIYHDGRCGKCGRQLTTPNSVTIGIGPECLKNINLSIEEKREIKLRQLGI